MLGFAPLVPAYSHLSIYKRSCDLCLCLEQVVRGFSRYHKYTLGADLREGARRVLKLIVRAVVSDKSCGAS